MVLVVARGFEVVVLILMLTMRDMARCECVCNTYEGKLNGLECCVIMTICF